MSTRVSAARVRVRSSRARVWRLHTCLPAWGRGRAHACVGVCLCQRSEIRPLVRYSCVRVRACACAQSVRPRVHANLQCTCTHACTYVHARLCCARTVAIGPRVRPHGAGMSVYAAGAARVRVRERSCVRACACVCVHALHAWVRACACARAFVCICTCAYVRASVRAHTLDGVRSIQLG